MLKLEGVQVTQGAFTLNTDLAITDGARVALMGISGSGKSTLLNVISGFIWPDAGRVVIDDQNVSRAKVASRPLSILFQDGNLFPHLSVFDNVALGISPSLRLSTEDQERVDDALTRVGLAGFGARKPADLSGGQRSRVALARMLLRGKPLCLLDEPFSALDPGLRREMLELMRALCEDNSLTLIMATHDLRDAEQLCDHLLLLQDGGVVLNEVLADAIDRAPDALRPWM
ncbi:ATP-binding cassette domain-containing protein [Gymnodinialimonas sp. 2305UL16-5]|uniref:thiamine ABC transporter ATP-binding protein n=1 Tax=Gymnodinialimonas mytili TaxID=3126503 RepID=UPI0030A435AB